MNQRTPSKTNLDNFREAIEKTVKFITICQVVEVICRRGSRGLAMTPRLVYREEGEPKSNYVEELCPIDLRGRKCRFSHVLRRAKSLASRTAVDVGTLPGWLLQWIDQYHSSGAGCCYRDCWHENEEFAVVQGMSWRGQPNAMSAGQLDEKCLLSSMLGPWSS